MTQRRPLQLLRALDAAQREALEVPAGTTSREGEVTYASSDDALRIARGLLHRHGLTVRVAGSSLRHEGGKLVVALEVEVHHADTGQELLRRFEGQVDEWGTAAASISTLAAALRMLLLLPRERAVTRDVQDDLPRATTRVVVPAPAVPVVQHATSTADAKRIVRELMEALSERATPDPRAWRSAASVPTTGSLSLEQLQRYAEHLRAELARYDRGSEDTGEAWARVELEGRRPVLMLGDTEAG